MQELAELPRWQAHKALEGIITTPGSRETNVDKMHCLRAYTTSGIRTIDPLVTGREHEPLHHRKTIKIQTRKRIITPSLA